MRRKGLKRRRVPESVEDVAGEVYRVLGRQKPGGRDDLSPYRDEIDELVAGISEFRPAWTETPSVHRVAIVETRYGTTPFEDTVELPDVEHEYPVMLEMLGHIRQQRGLPPVTMPLFLHPDEIELALAPSEPVSPMAVLAGLPETPLQPLSDRRRRRVLRRRDWSETRQAVLDRDDWKCRKCGSLKDLQLYRVDEALDEHDPDAYVTLCRACVPPEPRDVLFRGHRLTPDDVVRIRSQLAVAFQRGSVQRVGFVLGSDYTIMRA